MILSNRLGAIGARLLTILTFLTTPLAPAQPCGDWKPGAPFDAVASAEVVAFTLQPAGGADILWCATRGGAHDEAKRTDGSGVWTTEPPPFPTVRYTAASSWNGQPVFGFYDAADPTVRGVTLRTSSGWASFDAAGFPRVSAFAELGGTLYAVGTADEAGSSRGSIWANSGAGWSVVAIGESGSQFLAAAAYNGQVYIGGRFASIQMMPAGPTLNAVNLARFSGSIWTEVPFSRLDGRVTALHAHMWDPTSIRGGELVVSGDFLLAGGVNANHLAAFTDPPMPGYWHSFGSGLDGGPATGFATRPTGPLTADLLVGGPFASAGGVANTRSLARWSSGAWSSVGVQFTTAAPVYLQSALGVTAIGGGGIQWMLGVRASFVVGFDGHRIHTIGRGTDHEVFDLTTSTDGQTLFAVGNFSLIENTRATHVAAKPLTTPNAPWNPVGVGTNGFTSTVLGDGGNVYIGGQFTQAGYVSATNIARWDGTVWSAMPGLISTWTGVSDLLMFNGLPTAIGGTFAGNSGLAQWDGTAWQGVGPAWPTSPYYSIPTTACLHNGEMHIAGGLNLPGAGTCTIARWTGSTWATVGAFPLDAHGLASCNGVLYASSSTIGGGGDSTVYRLDGADWIPLNGPDAPTAAIYELKTIDGRVYAAGAEGYAGVYNGAAWRRLDKLGPSGSTVYTVESGGGFNHAIVFGGSFGAMAPGIPTRNIAWMSGCLADYNCSGTVSVQDLFDFLSAYFANDPAADINGSGVVSVQDIFDYLAAYFAGCA